MYLNLTLIIVKFVLKVPPHWKSLDHSVRKVEESLLHLVSIKMRNLDANVKVFFKPFYMNSAVSIAKTVEIDESFVYRRWRTDSQGSNENQLNTFDENTPNGITLAAVWTVSEIT